MKATFYVGCNPNGYFIHGFEYDGSRSKHSKPKVSVATLNGYANTKSVNLEEIISPLNYIDCFFTNYEELTTFLEQFEETIILTSDGLEGNTCTGIESKSVDNNNVGIEHLKTFLDFKFNKTVIKRTEPLTYWKDVVVHPLLNKNNMIIATGSSTVKTMNLMFSKGDNELGRKVFSSTYTILDTVIPEILTDIIDLYLSKKNKVTRTLVIDLSFVFKQEILRLYTLFGKEIFLFNKVGVGLNTDRKHDMFLTDVLSSGLLTVSSKLFDRYNFILESFKVNGSVKKMKIKDITDYFYSGNSCVLEKKDAVIINIEIDNKVVSIPLYLGYGMLDYSFFKKKEKKNTSIVLLYKENTTDYLDYLFIVKTDDEHILTDNYWNNKVYFK